MKLPNNITKVDTSKKVSVPVYSKIRVVNGNIIGVIEKVIEAPIELLREREDK